MIEAPPEPETSNPAEEVTSPKEALLPWKLPALLIISLPPNSNEVPLTSPLEPQITAIARD